MAVSKPLPTGPPTLTVLYTNIGRGHPFYLDGIVGALTRRRHLGLVRHETDVFAVSTGPARLAWNAARWMYHHGSRSGPLGRVYARLRRKRDYNRNAYLVRLMGQSLRRRFLGDDQPLLVAHPSLVGILRGRPHVLYQHGELVAPAEACVIGAEFVFVPTEKVANAFVESGYSADHVIVTGLCVEPALARQAADAYHLRLARMQNEERLTGLFVSSGAEPPAHVTKLAAAAVSTSQQQGRAIILARRYGRLWSHAIRVLTRKGLPFLIVKPGDSIPLDLPPVVIIGYANRREENHLTAAMFPRLDFVVAPPHERSNWALGLGLPMFLIGPDVGPFAPLNRERLLRAGVAESVLEQVDAHLMGSRVRRWQHSGRLANMAAAGWGRLSIDGFDRIAEFLVTKYGQTS